MPGERAGGERVPIVGVPAERMHQRAERQRGIGDAAGHHDVGALLERLRDRARAEIEIGGDDLASRRAGSRRRSRARPARRPTATPLRSSPSTMAIAGRFSPCSRASARMRSAAPRGLAAPKLPTILILSRKAAREHRADETLQRRIEAALRIAAGARAATAPACARPASRTSGSAARRSAPAPPPPAPPRRCGRRQSPRLRRSQPPKPWPLRPS